MADTWMLAPSLRLRARPTDAVTAAAPRPRARPDALAPATPATDVAQAPATPPLRPDGLGASPSEVREAATIPEALPLDETVLIGLLNGPSGGTALLRLPGGGVVKVAAGGQVDGARIVAVTEDGVRLQRGGEMVLLTIPG